MLVGVISDTHGYIDPRLEAAFAGVEAIIHAGDVGSVAVLQSLAAIAPVYAVQGNNDVPLGGLGLEERLNLELGGCSVHVVHHVIDAQPLPQTQVVVFGHSHVVLNEHRGGLLYLNPGAAGRRGFHRLQTVALLRIEDGRVEATLRELGPRLPALRSATNRVKTGFVGR